MCVSGEQEEMMDLISDMKIISNLTAKEPEAVREAGGVGGVVIFPKTMAEALQKHEISKRHCKFHS